MKKISLLILALVAMACEPDWDALTSGAPSLSCEYSAVDTAITTVPAGECWRVASTDPDLLVRLEGETCSDARECLTAREGETVVPVSSMLAGDDVGPDVTIWNCEALATACDGAL
jgi:hypothetical protein